MRWIRRAGRLAVVTSAVIVIFVTSGCSLEAACSSDCHNVLDLCSSVCPGTVGTMAGYGGAKAFCSHHPEDLGCANLP